MKAQQTELSASQSSYLASQKKERRLVLFLRIAVLILFLVLWEWTAGKGIIDSFIFSSPSKILACFLSMAADKSIFPHLSVTLYETIISFFLVTGISILVAVLLWFSR